MKKNLLTSKKARKKVKKLEKKIKLKVISTNIYKTLWLQSVLPIWLFSLQTLIRG